jgi:molybdopterin-guanine dinucleotide biosynthesis protein A
MISQELLGVVLCGGQSYRMGSDKALLKTGDQTWVEQSIQLFSKVNIPVVLSINRDQEAAHVQRSSIKAITDNTSIHVKGPLLGLLTIHQAHPDKDLFVLACDLPNMNAEVIKELCDKYSEDQGRQAYVFANEDGYEPLCAIYTSVGLTKIEGLRKQGKLQKFSMKYVLDLMDTAVYPLPHEWKRYFTNVNTPEELNNLQFKR